MEDVVVVNIEENERTEAIHLGKLNNNRKTSNFGDCWAISKKKQTLFAGKTATILCSRILECNNGQTNLNSTVMLIMLVI